MIIYIVAFVIILALAEWVYQDAKTNSTQSATFWSIITLLFSLLGVLAYLLVGRNANTTTANELWRCRECGEEINRTDEFCSGCGVRLEMLECENCGTSIGAEDDFCSSCGTELGGRSFSQDERDGTEYENSVTDVWYHAILIATSTVIFLFAIYILIPIHIFDAIGTIALVGSLLVMPVCFYKDIKYMKANSRWRTENGIWIIALGAVPYLNIATAIAYLYHRHCVLGIPSLNSITGNIRTVLRK